MPKQYELDDVTIRNGDYVSKKDHSPISGSLVSRHKNGSVYTETFVEGGEPTGQSKTYTPNGQLVSQTESPLSSKQSAGVTYQSVSAQYRRHNQKNIEMLPYFIFGFVGFIFCVVTIYKIRLFFKAKR